MFHLVDWRFKRDLPCARIDEHGGDSRKKKSKRFVTVTGFNLFGKNQKLHFDHYIICISTLCDHISYRTGGRVEGGGWGCITHGLFLSAPDSAILTELLSCRTRSVVIFRAQIRGWSCSPGATNTHCKIKSQIAAVWDEIARCTVTRRHL